MGLPMAWATAAKELSAGSSGSWLASWIASRFCPWLATAGWQHERAVHKLDAEVERLHRVNKAIESVHRTSAGGQA
jgi:hypothetical protein